MRYHGDIISFHFDPQIFKPFSKSKVFKDIGIGYKNLCMFPVT